MKFKFLGTGDDSKVLILSFSNVLGMQYRNALGYSEIRDFSIYTGYSADKLLKISSSITIDAAGMSFGRRESNLAVVMIRNKLYNDICLNNFLKPRYKISPIILWKMINDK